MNYQVKAEIKKSDEHEEKLVKMIENFEKFAGLEEMSTFKDILNNRSNPDPIKITNLMRYIRLTTNQVQ